jgi:ATP-binding cassette, subfamily B, bacterial
MKHWWLRLGSYALPERRRLGLLMLLMLLAIALEALVPWPLKLILDHVLVGDPLPTRLEWMLALPGSAETALLGWLVFSVLALFVAAKLVLVARNVLETGLATRMQYALARDVFAHLQSLSLRFHGRAAKGDLVRRAAEDTSCVPQLVTGVFVPLLHALLLLVVLFAIMWQLDRTLALVALGAAVPMGILMKLLGPRMTERAYQEQQTQGELWAVSEHTLTALPLVQAFGREEHQGMRFQGVAVRSIRAHLRTLATQIQFKLGVEGLVALGTAAVLVLGGYRVLSGTSTVGTLVVFLSYLAALYAPLVTLAYLSPAVATAAGSARRVTELLDSEDTVRDAPDARPLVPEGGRIRGHVRFEGVRFGYLPGCPILHGIDLDVSPGETIALVGATGAGKSTLLSLLPRLFDPWEGRVLFDGQDLRNSTLASVREQVALVLQDPFLLPVSVAENIAYARPDASLEAIVAAAETAHADEFIRRLADGYHTVIGERGISLSGGQRQRLAIARALLKDAPILILDEPTAALDAGTEAEVISALERLSEGRTTFIIAHRFSTIRRADRIAVLDAGTLAEIGTHQELIARRGLFYRLYASPAQHLRGASGPIRGMR